MELEELIAIMAAPIYAQMVGNVGGSRPDEMDQALGAAYELWKRALMKPWQTGAARRG